jgi:hypothetical protein
MKPTYQTGVATGMLLVAALAGCAKVVAFSTATKFGLDVSQRADQTIDVSMGYDRVEVASIPTVDKNASQNGDDTYAVLGTFNVEYGNPFLDQPLIIKQFFATGWAARTAAKTPGFIQHFGKKTGQILERPATAEEQGTMPAPPGPTR